MGKSCDGCEFRYTACQDICRIHARELKEHHDAEKERRKANMFVGTRQKARQW